MQQLAGFLGGPEILLRMPARHPGHVAISVVPFEAIKMAPDIASGATGIVSEDNLSITREETRGAQELPRPHPRGHRALVRPGQRR